MTHEAERPSRFTPTGSSTGIHHDTFREETFSRGARSTPENSKLVVPSFRSNVSQSFTRSRPISFRSTECDVRGDMGLKSQRFQCLQCGKITLLDAESCLVLDEPNSSLGQGLFSAWPFSAKASETYLVPQPGLKTVTPPLSDVRDENSAIPEQADWIDLGGRSPDSLPSPPLTKHSANSPCSEKSTVLASTEQRIHINDTLGCLIFCADVCERMSKYTQADYPLCPKCCEVHLQHLDDEIRTTWKVRDEYKEKLLCAKARAYAQQTNPGEVPSEESVEGLRNQVARLMQDLEECEEEVQHEYEQRIQLEKTRRGLQKRHSRCKRWDVRCHASQTYLFEKKIGLVERMEIKQHELRRLLRTNILNETFYLDTQGPLSTINGLKLMRAPNLHTQQNEINAAWSYYVILLHTLSQNMNLETKTYQLKVNGNWSTINNVTNSNEYELYVGARFWFANSRHEKAIAGFVHCVRELVQAIKQRQPHAGDPPVDMGQEGTGPLMCFTKGGTLTDEMWYVGIKSITMILKWCIYTTMSLAAS